MWSGERIRRADSAVQKHADSATRIFAPAEPHFDPCVWIAVDVFFARVGLQLFSHDYARRVVPPPVFRVETHRRRV